MCSRQYLPWFQVHRVQLAVVVLNLNGPGLVIIVILMSDVHNRADHMRGGLKER